MSQNYQQRSLASRFIIVFVGLWLLVSVFERVGGFTQIKGHLEQVFGIVQHHQVMALWHLWQPVKSLTTTSQLSAELHQTQRQYAQALSVITELETLREENVRLRELAGVDAGSAPGLVARPVVSLASPLIQAGYQQGVESGAMVKVEGVLVGIVGDVSANQSQVTLLSQRDAPMILATTESDVQGVVTGDGRNVVLTHVLPEDPLVPGERVLTVGQVGVGPRVLIGSVGAIKDEPTAGFKTAIINQHVSFYTSFLVEVVY